jgi:hypothetical protein
MTLRGIVLYQADDAGQGAAVAGEQPLHQLIHGS